MSAGRDAIVIGAGPNGLAAAIRLAEAGRQVLVLEAQDKPGGAVQTDELTLPGFRHDTFSAVYPAAAASPVFARMPLADHGLEWVHPRHAYAHPLGGGEAVLLDRDVAATAAGLDRRRGGDGERWAEFVQPFLDRFDAVRDSLLTGFPPLRGPLRLGPRRLAALARLLPGSAVALGRRLFRDGASRAWLYGSAMHGDAPLASPGSAITAFYLNLLGHAVGWPSPKGGAANLSGALAGYLTALGGEIRTGAKVERVLSAAGRVTGVATADQRFPAKTVIADVMPHALAELADLPGWYRAALRRYAYGPATVKVDWALDGPIPWANAEVAGAGTVHLAGAENMRPFVLLGQQSLADPTRAPAGKHTAWAYTHDLDWPAERIEAQVERFAPGFRGRILARHVLGPRDLQARNPNLVGGDVGGGSNRLAQIVFRPFPKLSPYRTPLNGLYLGSAAAFPGGAVHGVPGDAAARAAVRREG